MCTVHDENWDTIEDYINELILALKEAREYAAASIRLMEEARSWGEQMRDKLAMETNDGDVYIAPWENKNG